MAEEEEEEEEEGVISPALEGVTASVSVVWRGEKCIRYESGDTGHGTIF